MRSTWFPIIAAACLFLNPGPARAASQGLGFGLGYRTNEYTPSIDLVAQPNHTRLDIILGATVLSRDPYNKDRATVSVTGLCSFAVLTLGSLAHSEDVGAGGSNAIGWMTTCAAAIAGSRVYPYVVPLAGDSASNSIDIAPYVGSRAEVYATKEGWVRYAPSIGLELLRLGAEEPKSHARHGFAFRVGADRSVDMVPGRRAHWQEWRLEAGVRWTRIAPTPVYQ
ncbi:MAG: hypothetical protein ACM3PF_12165 [Bacteroidota bacterium]